MNLFHHQLLRHPTEWRMRLQFSDALNASRVSTVEAVANHRLLCTHVHAHAHGGALLDYLGVPCALDLSILGYISTKFTTSSQHVLDTSGVQNVRVVSPIF